MFHSLGFEHATCSLLSLLLLIALRINAATAQNAPTTPPGRFSDWTGWGANVYNNRWSTSKDINSTTLPQLEEHCKIQYPLGVSAAPVVVNTTAYYPTSSGSFYALNIGTCQYVWQVNVSKIIEDEAPISKITAANALPMSRTSPQIDLDRGILYFGTQTHAMLVALNLTTGEKLGIVRVDDHPLAILTMSPTLYNGNLYIGVSSLESSATMDETYPCCNFIGSFNSFSFDERAKKFTRRWQRKTLPEGKGWSGAGSWGSQPAIDPLRNQVFFSSGNIYTYPKEFVKCLGQPTSCLPPDVWTDSVIALDLDSGTQNWINRLSPLDAWVMVCGFAGAPTSSSALCPERPGPDIDFGMAPTFVPSAYGDGTTGKDSVIVGQKSGQMYSWDATTGILQWSVLTAPQEGLDGGPGAMSWGVASDDRSIYYTIINFGARNLTLLGAPDPQNNSAWGSLSLKTGALQWQVPVPDLQMAYTPPAVVNDVVFVGQSGSRTVTNDDVNLQVPGAVIALEKTTGATLATWPLDSIQRGGVTVAGGFIVFGTGYHYQNSFKTGSIHVYGLPGAIAEAKVALAVTIRAPNPATEGEPGASNLSKTADSTLAIAMARSSARRTAVLDIMYSLLGLVMSVMYFG